MKKSDTAALEPLIVLGNMWYRFRRSLISSNIKNSLPIKKFSTIAFIDPEYPKFNPGICPEGFGIIDISNCPGDGKPCCAAGSKPNCGQGCAHDKCLAAGGKWIPKNYCCNGYTCEMRGNQNI